MVAVGGTAAVSTAIGALSGANIRHALAVGFYVAGAAVLVGSFALGTRGPTRVNRTVDPDRPGGLLRGRRSRREATPEERRETRWASLGLFAFGVALLLFAAAVNPSRKAF